MPYNKTVNISFPSSGYTSNKPSFYSENTGFSDRMKFANTSQVLDLDSTTYGYAEFSISYSGSVDYVAISFHQGGERYIGVADSFDGLFTPGNEYNRVIRVIKDEISGATTTLYVFVNTDPNSVNQYLYIDVAVGKKDSAPSDVGVKLEYNCTTPTYVYTTGLHVYSPYDARGGSSVLTTKLYSKEPLSAWTINTKVYALPTYSSPALPYYYGYGSNVYKVGGEFDRAYGYKTSYTVSKKLFGKPQIKENIIGPEYFYDPVNETSEACVVPIMSDVGLIKEILPNSGLTQPQSYRYYTGYDLTTIRKSNDSVFTTYSFNRKVHDPVVGSTHALEKVIQGVFAGFGNGLKLNWWAIAALPLGAGAALLGARQFIVSAIAQPLYDYLQRYVFKVCASKISQSLTVAGTTGAFNVLLGTVLGVIGWALLAYSVYKLLTKTVKITIKEPCKLFLHKFTSTPYINTSNVIYNSNSLTGVTNGYYCDGVYYYTQSGGSVTKKELSYTYAIQQDDPPKYKLEYSIQADSPTLVVAWDKLLVLPYTSGKPIPYCNGNTIYYNTTQTTGFTNTCCALELSGGTVSFSVPANTFYSCTSVNDANEKAKKILQSGYNYLKDNGEYCVPYADNDVGLIDTSFTHEIKIENYPTQVTLYYSLKNGTINTGTTLYYDVFGCTKVLNGYYAVSGSSPYRTFYYVTGGTIQSIHTMSTSSSTTTNTGQTIKTNNLDYSSNWYYTSISYQEDFSTTNSWSNNKSFDPNTLYTNSQLKKGFAKYSQTNIQNINGVSNQEVEDFQLYNDFTNTGYTEANAGWYRPLIDWIQNFPFYYYKAKSMTINIEEDCQYQTDSNIQRGFYIYGKIGSDTTPTINDVQLSVAVYTTGATSNTLLQTIDVITKGSENKTFVAFDKNIVKSTTKVSNILITNIVSPNPLNKVTYTIGDKILCLGSNCDIKLGVSVTGTTNTAGDNGYARITYSGGTGPYDLYLNNWYYDTTSFSGTSLLSGLVKGVTYTFKTIDANKCSNEISFTVNGTTTISNITTGSTGTDYYTSDYIVLFCKWGTTHRFDFLVRAITPTELKMDIPYGMEQSAWFKYTWLGLDKYYPWVGEPGFPKMPYYAYLSQYNYYTYNSMHWPRLWKNNSYIENLIDSKDGIVYKPSYISYITRPMYTSFIDITTWEKQRPYMWFPRISQPDVPTERLGYHYMIIDVGAIRKDYYNNGFSGGTHTIKIDCKGRWYGDYDMNSVPNVYLEATYYKQGTIPYYYYGSHQTSQTLPYPSGDSRWNDTSNYKTINTPDKKIITKIAAKLLADGQYVERPFGSDGIEKIETSASRDRFILSGERIATLNLNIQTGEFKFDINDTTPSL